MPLALFGYYSSNSYSTLVAFKIFNENQQKLVMKNNIQNKD